MLIDCDVHISPGTVLDIADYTDSATRELLLHSGTHGLSLPTTPGTTRPAGCARTPTTPTSDDPALHTIDLARCAPRCSTPTT